MVKFDKGPEVYLQALASGDPERVAEAEAFLRESFRAKFGCYPEDLEEVHDCPCGATSADWSKCTC